MPEPTRPTHDGPCNAMAAVRGYGYCQCGGLANYATALEARLAAATERAEAAERERDEWREQFQAVKAARFADVATFETLTAALADAQRDTARIDWLAEKYIAADFAYEAGGPDGSRIVTPIFDFPQHTKFSADFRATVDSAASSVEGGGE